jgi:endonuclease YncB( thermonuclease family)
VAPGDVVDERTEGDSRIVHRRVSATIRMAGFNLGDYAHARVERGGYSIDICANRALEAALQPPRPKRFRKWRRDRGADRNDGG